MNKIELMKLADDYVQAVIRDRLLRQDKLGPDARKTLELAMEDACDSGLTPEQSTASKLIEAWTESHGRRCPWDTAVGITAIVTKMDEDERARLLALGV